MERVMHQPIQDTARVRTVGQGGKGPEHRRQGGIVQGKEPGLVHQLPHPQPALGTVFLLSLPALRLDVGQLLPLHLQARFGSRFLVGESFCSRHPLPPGPQREGVRREGLHRDRTIIARIETFGYGARQEHLTVLHRLTADDMR
jgi:hypothetical protein